MTEQLYGCTECSRYGRDNCALHRFGSSTLSAASEMAALRAYEAMERAAQLFEAVTRRWEGVIVQMESQLARARTEQGT